VAGVNFDVSEITFFTSLGILKPAMSQYGFAVKKCPLIIEQCKKD
jgi:hypothetical protein